MMKKMLLMLLMLCLMTPFCLAEEEGPVCEFDLEAYGGVLKVTYADGSVEETGGWGVACEWAEGMTIGDALARLDVTGMEVVGEGDAFEGWLAFDIAVTVDEDGWEEYVYTLADGELLTTEALLTLPAPQSRRIYAAKWAGMPAEEYFAADAGEDFAVVLPAATLLANGGAILVDGEEEDYEIGMSAGTAEPGQLLGEVLELDRVLSVTREGHTFAGWAVYEVTEMETLDAQPEEGALYFEPYEDWFLVFRAYTLVAEKATTEEVSALAFGENDVYVVALWE